MGRWVPSWLKQRDLVPRYGHLAVLQVREQPRNQPVIGVARVMSEQDQIRAPGRPVAQRGALIGLCRAFEDRGLLIRETFRDGTVR